VQLSVGAVRATSAKHVMLLILLDACVGCLAFYAVGFAFAYGETHGDPSKGNSFIGWSGFALSGVPMAEWYMWFFQYAVCDAMPAYMHAAVCARIHCCKSLLLVWAPAWAW
jgi:ammonium transporter, Amt family